MKNRIHSLITLVIVLLFFPIVIAAQSSYTISGEVRDDNGHPFSQADVCAMQPVSRGLNVRDRVCAQSDEQGKFVVKLAQPGTYQVVADKISDGYMPSYLPFYKDARQSNPELILDGDHSTASVVVKLPPKSGLITGKVIDEQTDRRVPDFVVWIWQARDPNARTHLVVNGQSGMFRIFAPNVPFRMRVTADGYEDWVMGGGVLVSRAGATNGPGALLIKTGGKTDFAVYLKRKNPAPVDDVSMAGRLPAPLPVSPGDNQVFDVFPRNTRLEWNPVDGAISYAVEIESCWSRSADDEKRLSDHGECLNPSSFEEKYGLHSTNYEFTFGGAQPGRWRVWAYDKDHKPGSKSPWRRFVYTK